MKTVVLCLTVLIFPGLYAAEKPGADAGSVLPQVLLIGDSISVGYTPHVIEMLEGVAHVEHHKGNAGPTARGLERLDAWIGDREWDLIHFNWGLWDMYHWEYFEYDQSPEAYGKNLDTLVQRLKETGAKLIWASTTPACPGPEKKQQVLVDPDTERTYLDVAARIMKKHGIPVNDLHAFMAVNRKEYAIADNDVHFTQQGYRKLAERVAGKIRENLIASPEIKIVRPVESDAVLVNPGIGFMTFQRFNGDALNAGSRWTEGYPIEYQEFDGDLSNVDYPDTALAYFRVNWRFLEPEMGKYNWTMIDRALLTAAQRKQKLCLRISPYEGAEDKDVPGWYRELTGDAKKPGVHKWNVDPEHPEYLKRFGGLIRALGMRYDGHPDLEWVDISFIGYWGEGTGTHLLRRETRLALLNAYLDNFKKTHLIYQPLNGDAPDPGVLLEGANIAASWPDGTHNGSGPRMRNVGWRFDCLGDLGFWNDKFGDWNHMFDVYPRDIIRSGMSEAWKKAPVTLEICGTFRRWKEDEGYREEEVRYIFDQALKWHISSFNAKSSPVPDEWKPLVDEWLKRMGYRFVLRKFTYPETVRAHGRLGFTSWWENKGVAPIYDSYPLALRLRSDVFTTILETNVDIRDWMPGDALYEDAVFLDHDMPAGTYQLDLAIVHPDTREPVLQLAIVNLREDGWYPLGEINVVPALAGGSLNWHKDAKNIP